MAARESNNTEMDSPKWFLLMHSAKIGDTSITTNLLLSKTCFSAIGYVFVTTILFFPHKIR